MRIAFLATLVLLATASLGAPARSLAQEPASPTLTINQVDVGGYPDVTAVVTVLDGRGVPVPGLAAAQFQAFESQSQLQVSGVQAAQDEGLPLSVIVAIDVSGSMAGERIDQAKQAARAFVQALGPNDDAAILAFSDQVQSVVPLTNDRIQLTNGIAGLQASGGTALYEAVQTSAFAAGAAPSPRRAVVVLTDGENETRASEATREGSLTIARAAGVPVFTVSVGETTDEAYLQALAAVTTGRYVAATPQTIAAVYTDIAGLLRNQYVVTIHATQPADGRDGVLQLIALTGAPPPTASITYRHGVAQVAPIPTTVVRPPEPTPATDTSSSHLVAYVIGGAFAAVVLVALLLLFARWRRHRRLLREQLRVVEPNERKAAAQPLPRGAAGSAEPAAAAGIGTGTLTERGGDGRVFPLGNGPVVIGSSPRACTIVLNGGGVAPEHTRIWLREGRYLVHHVGGMSRKTLVGGVPADWVTLEAGDELQIGGWKFVFGEGDARA